LRNSRALSVDTGRGPIALAFAHENGLSGPIAQAPATLDKTVRALGWTKSDAAPLWRVEQSTPVGCTILSVMTEVSING
jgi:hypothetical protein